MVLSEKEGMRWISFFILFSLVTQSVVLGRTPSIPRITDDLQEKICEYRRLEVGKPKANVMFFISLFENMYNTNQISDKKLKEEVFCLLKTFYQQDDPYFAEDFSKEMPNVSCKG